jgi:hypothetical protein
MGLTKRIATIVVLTVATLLYMVVMTPTPAEAGGPYFSSLYTAIKIINSGYMTITDSLRVGGVITANGGINVVGAQTQSGKLVVTDSLRVNRTSLLIGDVTTSGAISVGGKATVTDSLRVNRTTLLIGGVTTSGTLAIGGALTTNSVVCDSNAFVGNAATDTVAVSGAAGTDKYLAVPRSAAAPDTIGLYSVQATATGFVLHRTAATAEANEKYVWWRIK